MDEIKAFEEALLRAVLTPEVMNELAGIIADKLIAEGVGVA